MLVTCAIILKSSRVLVTQRSEFMKLPLKWEFPGGKIESHESAEDCILREIKEELNIEIELVQALGCFPFAYENFEITLIPYIANYVSGDLTLNEHKDFKWLTIEELTKLDWALADIPVLNHFLNLHNDGARTI
jgi:8-oxo-dGTP diphosphatase